MSPRQKAGNDSGGHPGQHQRQFLIWAPRNHPAETFAVAVALVIWGTPVVHLTAVALLLAALAPFTPAPTWLGEKSAGRPASGCLNGGLGPWGGRVTDPPDAQVKGPGHRQANKGHRQRADDVKQNHRSES